MALFIGGPADGARLVVEPHKDTVCVAINPHPPAFTPDQAVLSAVATPTVCYKREALTCGSEVYTVFTPTDWSCNDLIEALVLNYRSSNDVRLSYIKNAEGKLYDNDDRAPGRNYQV